MFKNCVFKADVNTTQWVKAAVRRAVKTMAQTFVATIGTAAAMGEVNWPLVASATVLAGILSLGTSVAGLQRLRQNKSIKGGGPLSPSRQGKRRQ